MKSIVICLLAAFVVSCSSENEKPSPAALAHLTADVQPENSDNPYDEAGQLFIDIFNTYYDGSVLPASISGISERVEAIAGENSRFNTLKGTSYAAAPVSRIGFINDHPTTCVRDVVDSLQMTSTAKSSLKLFINGVCGLAATENDYNTIHTYVTDYEAGVIADTAMTNHDKQVILCTASICRYSVYKQMKKPKRNTDPEWGLIITHITAGSDGADTGICQAITESLTSGIAANQ